MNGVVVDTNVIVIANDTDDERADCRDRCQDRIQQILSGPEKVVIDDDWRILNEYKRNTKPNTRKGIGDLFVKTLLQNQTNPNFCKVVNVTSLTGNGTDFEEYPNDDEALKDFHKKDRKFIAVSLAYKKESGQTATILLAIDRGWKDYLTTFAEHGVPVDILCDQ